MNVFYSLFQKNSSQSIKYRLTIKRFITNFRMWFFLDRCAFSKNKPKAGGKLIFNNNMQWKALNRYGEDEGVVCEWRHSCYRCWWNARSAKDETLPSVNLYAIHWVEPINAWFICWRSQNWSTLSLHWLRKCPSYIPSTRRQRDRLKIIRTQPIF